ncbi:MAG: hypothetical protein HQL58_08090 [Magnetococcales bacterium]|nr:hypothetical protein [Magnetococcales bacterium]
MKKFQLHQTLQKIERLGKGEREYKKVLSMLPDHDLAQLEKLDDPDNLTENEFERLDDIVTSIYHMLVQPGSSTMRHSC